MDQTNFIQKINPKILFAVFFVLIIILLFVIFAIISNIKPTNNNNFPVEGTPTPVAQQIPQNVTVLTPIIEVPDSATVNRYGDVAYAQINKVFPQKTNLYTFSPAQITNQIATNIAGGLGFSNTAKSSNSVNGSTLSYQQEAKNIIFYLEAGNVQYSNTPINDSRTVNDKKSLIPIATTFLQRFSPLNTNLSPDSDSVTYYTGSGDLTQVFNFSDATVYDVPFYQNINGTKIYNQLGSSAAAHVLVSLNGHVLSVTLNTPNLLSAKREVSLKSLDQAKKEISQGDGVIAQYGNVGQTNPLPIPDRTTFTDISLGYLRDFPNGTIYPIYVFSGTAYTGNNSQPIVVYLPAVK